MTDTIDIYLQTTLVVWIFLIYSDIFKSLLLIHCKKMFLIPKRGLSVGDKKFKGKWQQIPTNCLRFPLAFPLFNKDYVYLQELQHMLSTASAAAKASSNEKTKRYHEKHCLCFWSNKSNTVELPLMLDMCHRVQIIIFSLVCYDQFCMCRSYLEICAWILCLAVSRIVAFVHSLLPHFCLCVSFLYLLLHFFFFFFGFRFLSPVIPYKMFSAEST